MHWSNETVQIVFPGGVVESKKVWQWLDEIVQRAHQAHPPNIDLIIHLAIKCCADDHNGNVPGHDAKLSAAVIAARDGLWSIVAYELDHDV